jgi:DNA-binding transcriptional regulator YdaS (Cro superfamily)
MRLHEYLEEHGTPNIVLARRAGIHHTTLARTLQGHEILLSVALKIEDATKGQVTCRDLAPDVYLESKPHDKREEKKHKPISKKK